MTAYKGKKLYSVGTIYIYRKVEFMISFDVNGNYVPVPIPYFLITFNNNTSAMDIYIYIYINSCACLVIELYKGRLHSMSSGHTLDTFYLQ